MSDDEHKAAVGGVRFSIYYSDRLEKTVTLAQDCIFIGRLLTSHLPIEDPKVSRMHAVVEIREGKEVILSDLESSNGTRVNGQEEHIITLKTNDVIEVGDSKIKVEILSGKDIASMPQVIYHSGISRGLSKQVGVDTVMLDAAALEDVQVSSDEIDSIIGQLEPSLKSPEAAVETTQPGEKRPDLKEVGKRPPPAKPTRLLRGMGTALELKIQWGEEILDVQHLDQPVTVTAGKHKQNTYIIPPMEAFPNSLPIISPVTEKKGGGYMLGFTDNMEGWVYTGDRLQSLSDLKNSPRLRSMRLDKKRVYLYPLSPSDKGVLSIENLAFCFQTVRSFPAYRSPVNKVNRRPFWAGLSLYAAISMLFFFVPMPESEPTVAEQVQETVAVAELLYSRERAKGFLEQLVSQDLQSGSPFGEVGGKTQIGTRGVTQEKRTSGKRGKRGKEFKRLRNKDRGRSGRDMADALDALKSDDIMRILGSSGFTGKGGGVGARSGSGKVASAPRVFVNLGGSLRDVADSREGAGGIGFGGGESVDVGGLSTKGRGGGQGGYGTVRLGKKLEVAIDDSDEDDIAIRGALDKRLVERVIKRNLGQIRLCYDTKLQFERGKKGRSSGRVQMAWRIAPNGQVTRAKVLGTSLNDARFEQCIADRIRTWIFPEPKGGGSVRVEYPFVFRPVG